MGLLGDKSILKTLVEVLGEKGSVLAVQAAVATALGYVGDYRAIVPLRDMLQDKDKKMTKREPRVRRGCARNRLRQGRVPLELQDFDGPELHGHDRDLERPGHPDRNLELALSYARRSACASPSNSPAHPPGRFVSSRLARPRSGRVRFSRPPPTGRFPRIEARAPRPSIPTIEPGSRPRRSHARCSAVRTRPRYASSRSSISPRCSSVRFSAARSASARRASWSTTAAAAV